MEIEWRGLIDLLHPLEFLSEHSAKILQQLVLIGINKLRLTHHQVGPVLPGFSANLGLPPL